MPTTAHIRRSSRALAAGAALLTAVGCMANPAADAAAAEAITEIGNELGYLRDEQAQLQHQVDSLRAALARQDTLLRQLANLAGAPISP